MKKIGTIILFCLLVLVAACTPKGIIPARKMAAINAEMFLLDQYAGSDRQMRRFTDTAAIYKPLLRSFGYSADEYLASVDYYLNNTREMAKVLDQTEAILKKREAKILKTIEKNAQKADTAAYNKRRRIKSGAEIDSSLLREEKL